MYTRETESAGGVVVNTRGEVLVVSQNGDSWSLPKGRVEKGEDNLATAKREIVEESGVKNLTFVKQLPSYKRFSIGKGGKGEDTTKLNTIHMFLFRTEDTELSPTDPENPEARWILKEAVADLLTHPKDKEFFHRILFEL